MISGIQSKPNNKTYTYFISCSSRNKNNGKSLNQDDIQIQNIDETNEISISLEVNPANSGRDHPQGEYKPNNESPSENFANNHLSLPSSRKGKEVATKDMTRSKNDIYDFGTNANSLSPNRVRFNLKNSFREFFYLDDDDTKDRKMPQKQRLRKLSPASLGSPYGNWKKRKRIRKTSEQRNKELFDKKADKSIRSSVLCIYIAVTFFILTMPSNIRGSVIPIDKHHFFWNDDVVALTNFFEGLNYSCNFLIYCVANSIIRKQYKNDVGIFVAFFVNLKQRIINVFMR